MWSIACAEAQSVGEMQMHLGPSTTAAEGRLAARPSAPKQSCEPGSARLGLKAKHDALLYVPKSVKAGKALPLVVLLHGAGGNAEGTVGMMRDQAEEKGFLLLVPQSREYTWDVILGGYGPDVQMVDEALEKTFAQCAVERDKIAVSGFSDGASYALSLGLTNGELFSSVLAFSPGFVAAGELQGRPEVFVSHGIDDNVLPISRCSRRIVPELKGLGYRVDYREFDGGHQVPQDMLETALKGFLRG